MDDKDCNICTEKYGKRRFKITCTNCKNSCCTKCIERYFKMNETNLCHCMFCHTEWSYKFLYENFPKNVLQNFKREMETYLMKKEKVLIPQSQKYIHYDKYIQSLEEFVKKKLVYIDEINKILKNIEINLILNKCDHCRASFIFYRDKYCYKCNNEICNNCRKPFSQNHVCNPERKSKFNMYLKYIDEKNNSYNTINDLKYKIHKWRKNYEMDDEISLKEFFIVCQCPKDDCNGCITNERFECNICLQLICSRCNIMIKQEDKHICKTNDIKTNQTLKKITKPCPKCAVPIQKIDGCNQMWCTQCNTAFDWTSGKIIKGQVHNPHYFEWFNSMNNNTQNVSVDIDCNGLPDQRFYLTHINLVMRKQNFFLFNYFSMSLRLTLHIQDVIITENHNPLVENLDLRLRLIQHKISENSLKQSLYRRYKKKKINEVIHEVFEMFVLVNGDIYRKIMYENDIGKMNSFKVELDNIISYTNSCFEKLQNVFHLMMPKIVIQNEHDQFIFHIRAKYNYIDIIHNT
jgi:hypothetical protein